MKNKHQPVCCSVSSVCLILQGSGSLIFSLSSLINSVFDQISALPDALILVLTSELMDVFQHLLVNNSGRSFTDDGRSFIVDHVIAVGGASLMNCNVGGADLSKSKIYHWVTEFIFILMDNRINNVVVILPDETNGKINSWKHKNINTCRYL